MCGKIVYILEIALNSVNPQIHAEKCRPFLIPEINEYVYFTSGLSKASVGFLLYRKGESCRLLTGTLQETQTEDITLEAVSELS